MKRASRTLCFLVALTASSLAASGIRADDPLSAFPTAENPVEDRVSRLNADQLAAIELPDDARAVIFSFDLTPLAGDETHGKRQPLLQVRSDGTFECVNIAERTINVGSPALIRTGKLTAGEVQWLMHLAVNECDILERTTVGVESQYELVRSKRGANRRSGSTSTDFVTRQNHAFEAATKSARNSLVISDRLLTLRSLRRAMKLEAFASLQKYAIFIVNRQSLGEEPARNSLLAELNEKLRSDAPAAAPFCWEHLVSAASIKGTTTLKECELTATFVQAVVGPNRGIHKIYGRIELSEKDAVPTFTIWRN